LPAQWLTNSSDLPGRIGPALEQGLHSLSQPRSKLVIRRSLLVILVLWALYAAASLVWALLPQPEPETAPLTDLVNPARGDRQQAARTTVDLEQLSSWQLFGTPVADAEEPELQGAGSGSSRDGIEEGASETRLALTLRGVVASTEDGLGHAIIEYRSQQAVYAVEDELPVPGKVVLAKVMPKQVVLDNAGTYELLTLFEETALDRALMAPGPETAPRSPATSGVSADAQQIDKRNEQSTSALATQYRDQLYRDPGSLAEVVRITAVREGGSLRGYRVAPGREREQFASLGFKPGDLVTSVNGMALDDPANTMRLYQTMRSATEAVFGIERDGQPVQLAVSLGASGAGQP
jgi:general secretion pathway protein C